MAQDDWSRLAARVRPYPASDCGTQAESRATGYSQVCEALSQQIRSRYRTGERLKSERALATEFGVNRHTVRRALQELEHRGLITTVRGSGSIVVDSKISHRVTFQTRFTTSASLSGVVPRTTVLRATNSPPMTEARQCAELFGRRPTGMIITLRYAGDAPVCWIRHMFAGVDAEAVARGFEGGSLHAHLERSLGITFTRRESRVSADRPGTADIKYLHVPRELPMLCASSFNVSQRDDVWEISLTRFRSDSVDLRFSI